VKLLVDNDVIHKLAAFDLLPAAVVAKVGGACEMLVGPRTRFSMYVRKNQAKGQRKFGIDVHARIVAFVECAKAIEQQTCQEDFATIAAADTQLVNEGEALLFAAAANDPDALVATGDHRSIEALAALPTCASIVGRLQGKVLVVEHFVLAAIASMGFAKARSLLLPGISVDNGIHARAFGSGEQAEEHVATEGLRQRIEGLRRRAGGILHP
jgi:hypothetical protein